MAIEMIGCSFCPLSPQDPTQRLHALVQQTKNRLVLIHSMTRDKFTEQQHIVCDIDAVLNSHTMVNDDHYLHRLSTIPVTPESIAYVIFTSGSTGTPKAVSSSCSTLFYYEYFFSRFKCAIKTSPNVCILLCMWEYFFRATLSYRWLVVHTMSMSKKSWVHYFLVLLW